MITKGMPFADYLALPSLHFSTLRALDLSPKHYRRAVDHGRADTDALRIGRVAHAMILTPDAPSDVAVWDGGRRAGKAWESFAADNAARTIVKRDDLATVEAMRASVLSHPLASRLLADGDPEVTVEWKTAGFDCRCRVDWLRPNGGIVELKTTRMSGPRAFMREFASRLYHAQVALYEDGIRDGYARHKEPMPPTYVIAVEKETPHDVCVYRIGGDTIEAGRRKVEGWIELLEQCRNSGQWPGAGGDDAIDMAIPSWALNDGLEDADLSGIEGGES